MKILITGGCGFIGSNLAEHALSNNSELTLFDNLQRKGSEKNLTWLKEKGNFQFIEKDIRDFQAVSNTIKEVKPDIIFHLSGQVAMTTSIADPKADFEINALGTVHVLESVRLHSPNSIIIFSSTNKVFGDLEYLKIKEEATRYTAPDFPNGFDENTSLNFQSPYGCSKGSADQYMLDYHRIFGLSTIVFRHSSIFGVRQFSTTDQGWVGWFIQQALEQKKNPNAKPFTISGNGKQVRDVLFSSDLTNCYYQAISNISKTKGQAYNIGGGMDNSLSLLELLQFLENELSIKLNYTPIEWRASDQKIFVANIEKAKKDFSFNPKIKRDAGLKEMIRWVTENDR